MVPANKDKEPNQMSYKSQYYFISHFFRNFTNLLIEKKNAHKNDQLNSQKKSYH